VSTKGTIYFIEIKWLGISFHHFIDCIDNKEYVDLELKVFGKYYTYTYIY